MIGMMAAGVVGDKYFFCLIELLSALLLMVDSVFFLRFGIIEPSDLSSVGVLNPSVPRGKLQLSPIVWVASTNLGEEFGKALTKIKSLSSEPDSSKYFARFSFSSDFRTK